MPRWWWSLSASECCESAGAAGVRRCAFFELLGPEGCRQLQAVAMDVNPAYELELRAHCPQT
jgi:hypothetical protein